MADADKCVMCGEVIPEGTWVCPKCVINPPSLPTLSSTNRQVKIVIGEDFWYSPHRQMPSNYNNHLLYISHNPYGTKETSYPKGQRAAHEFII